MRRHLAEDLLDVVEHGLGAGHRALVGVEQERAPRQELAAPARLGLDVHPPLAALAVAGRRRHRGQHVLGFVQVARGLLAGDVALEPVERFGRDLGGDGAGSFGLAASSSRCEGSGHGDGQGQGRGERGQAEAPGPRGSRPRARERAVDALARRGPGEPATRRAARLANRGPQRILVQAGQEGADLVVLGPAATAGLEVSPDPGRGSRR